MALQVQFWTISGLSVELRMNIRTDPCNKVHPRPTLERKL